MVNVGVLFEMVVCMMVVDSMFVGIVCMVECVWYECGLFVCFVDCYVVFFVFVLLFVVGIVWLLIGDVVCVFFVFVVVMFCLLIFVVLVVIVLGLLCCLKWGILVKGGGVFEWFV